ncbi:MAG: hypothetical protein JOZ40_21655, partial [Methylobacteriaceae bacterium]|nr:hypothetical protein [Methylobacteriaceae bacterium]
MFDEPALVLFDEPAGSLDRQASTGDDGVASSHSTRPLAVESDRLAELEKRVGELEEALAARDSFIAVVAHELRNPMTPIIGGIQRLRRMAGATPDLPSDIGTALGKLEWLIDRYIRR